MRPHLPDTTPLGPTTPWAWAWVVTSTLWAMDDGIVVMSGILLAAAGVATWALTVPGVDHLFAAVFAAITALTALFMVAAFYTFSLWKGSGTGQAGTVAAELRGLVAAINRGA